ncbi:8-amino-7-oxononanoate synthase, partial [Dermatophilus congolensis]|uniref:8-amino-7-oxononanoate synthase n=7 Tax=Dermatophilus congolensis TaxID=1863 RepID=UPI001AB044FD
MWEWVQGRHLVRQRRGWVRAAGPAAVVRTDLSSNDYLGLSRDPRVCAAARDAVERFGAGARASRVVSGTSLAHVECEQAVGELVGQPSVLLFSSGYTANLGVVSALAGPGTLLVVDEHVHASVMDAARLGRAELVVTPHGDVGAVARVLRERKVRRALVVVESVYSVLGDAADVVGLAQACARYDALLVVDEAHGVGVLGQGRGGVVAAGLAGVGHVVVTGTCSKALGSQGGFVAGPEVLRDHVVNTARSFIFDTGLAPACAAAAARAARIVAGSPELVAGLHVRADAVARICGVRRAPGAVQSVPVGDASVAVELAGRVAQRGVGVGCFRPPSVPDGVSRLRLSVDG